MSWAQGNEEPHKAAVRASIVARKRVTTVEQRDAVRWKGRQMSEQNLSAVTPVKEPKQDKEALRARWKWVEHTVWTDPMLRTLETGIKGGSFFDEAGLFNLTTARVKGR